MSFFVLCEEHGPGRHLRGPRARAGHVLLRGDPLERAGPLLRLLEADLLDPTPGHRASLVTGSPVPAVHGGEVVFLVIVLVPGAW